MADSPAERHMREFECEGVWWLPEESSARVGGTLRFSHEEGAVLSLLGTLGESAGMLLRKEHPIILGSAYDPAPSQEITLKRCRIKGQTVGVPGFTRETYLAERVFAGAHLVEQEDFLFTSCGLSISGLSAWAHHLLGFQVEMGEQGAFTVRYQPPPALKASLPREEVEATLYFGGGYASRLREYICKESVRFSVSSKEALPEEEWNAAYIPILLNFVTFATDSPNVLEELTLRRMEGGRMSSPVQMFAARVFSEAEQGGPPPHKMLFTLQDLGDEFAPKLRRWFEVYGRFYDACNLFFAIQYSPPSYVDVRLLTVMQCLELYQRARTGARPGQVALPPGLSARVPEDVRAALAEWLGRQVVDNSEAVLSALFDEHLSVMEQLFPGGKSAFLAEAMPIRNHVLYRTTAHPQLDDYARRLYLLTETLAFVMKACLLKELGFSEERVATIFQRHLLYNFIRGEYEKLRHEP
jgi:hypothetical protein